MSADGGRFFGKYRGKVENNVDPLNLGRVQVSVPAVLGDATLSWALPCSPYAGNGVGWFAVPPPKANIWVEFEAGDPDYPIWSGCFWNSGEVPVSPALAEKKMLKTAGVKLLIDDTQNAGGVTLEVDSPAVSTPLKMAMDGNGIQFTDDKATVTIKPAQIELKSDAVTVTVTDKLVEVKNGSVNFKATDSAMEFKCDSVTVKITASEVGMENSSAKIKLKSSAIELDNGGGKIQVSSSKVSINDGALEVQ